ncbi:MAG: 6-bladed beta-propeller [Gemmatimonadetes bacterium]|nr:6-bladed beta-propeller [Gemmatimonadota bacterium]
MRCLGVVIAMALVPLQAGTQDDVPLQASFQEVFRVGGQAAPEWAMFSVPGRVSFDGAGNLYVLDPSKFEVHVIDTKGRLLRTVGRQGEGPGEFVQPVNLLVWRDGAVAVVDVGKLAFQVFGPQGTFQRSVRMGIQGIGVVGRMNSMVATMAWIPPRGELANFSARDLADPSAMVRAAIANEVPYEPELLWDVLPDGTIVYSDSTAYVVKVGLDETLRRPMEPEKVTARIRSQTKSGSLMP